MTDDSEALIVNFVTYNVLSPSLAAPQHHSCAELDHLNNDNRLERLKKKLEPEITNGSVIVLQEVSQMWAGLLTVFFSKQNYFCQSRCYGGDFNGYMGVFIAFPLNKYSLEEFDMRRISDTIYWPDDERHEIHNNRTYSDKTLKSLENANRRFNAAIWVQVKDLKTKKQFCFATYHMPCMFKDPKVMDVHAGLFFRFVQEMSKGLPTLIGGDFNFKPDSSTYEMVTTGRPKSLVQSMFHNHKNARKISFGDDKNLHKINKKGNKNNKNKNKNGGKKNGNKKGGKNKKESEEFQREVVHEEGKGEFTEIFAMKSAYKEFMKEEPQFTNFSTKKAFKSGAPDYKFFGCLDYIFISDEWEVVDILELYKSIDDVTSKTFPDEHEPSDHIMLRATLKLE